jgi:hypothetical protein
MSDNNPASANDQRFATDLEVADAEAAPTRSADSLVVHGMLSMIAPDEPARLEARIERSIAAVHAESAATSPIARIGASGDGLGLSHALRARHSSWRRRIALAGGGIGIAAVLGFAVLFTPSGQSPSGSQAYAALDSIRAATARTEDRTFRVRIEHAGPREMARPSGAPVREGIRTGELVLGSGGRYTMTWRGAARGLAIVTGFSGSEYWAVLPDGTVRTADHPAKIKLPPMFGTEPARPGEDEDAEQLTLDSMLERLERGYEITFADRAPEAGKGGAPLIEVTAIRRAGAGRRDHDGMLPQPHEGAGERPRSGPGSPGGPGERSRPSLGAGDRSRPGPGGAGERPRPGPGGDRPGGPGPGPGPGGERHGPGAGPNSVRIVADASTFDVERLEARWTTGPLRAMLIERVPASTDAAARPAEWFTPSAHTRK